MFKVKVKINVKGDAALRRSELGIRNYELGIIKSRPISSAKFKMKHEKRKKLVNFLTNL